MNIWKQFQKLTQKQDLRVGLVLAHEGTDSVLQSAGGDQFRAIGTSVAVGQKAFVKDGQVQAQAPALTDVGVINV